jgi:GDP-D-mannose dehydratase
MWNGRSSPVSEDRMAIDLTNLLLAKGYQVVGFGRPGSLLGRRGDKYRARGVKLVEVDLLDRYAVLRATAAVAPDEIYNLAGNSFVPLSWDDPATAIRITSWPVIRLLDRRLTDRSRMLGHAPPDRLRLLPRRAEFDGFRRAVARAR